MEHLQQLNTMKAQLAEEAIMRQQDDMLHDEYALQAEVDFEEASDRMANTMGKAMAEAESRENRLKTDLSIMKRANLRLKGEKAMDTKKADRLIKDNTSLKDQA
ncbi:WD_REPEATS_REGION domain-containing protein, partial [Haematococcus lacustris]